MNTFKKVAIASALIALTNTASASSLDSDSATVSMNVGLFAALTGLDDFSLSTSDADGSAGAVYSGSDSFNLESNGQVRVTLAGNDLSNGADSVSTSYSLDSAGLTFDTAADSVHNASHSVAASATLGNISGQKAGAYSAQITITVSAI